MLFCAHLTELRFTNTQKFFAHGSKPKPKPKPQIMQTSSNGMFTISAGTGNNGAAGANLQMPTQVQDMQTIPTYNKAFHFTYGPMKMPPPPRQRRRLLPLFILGFAAGSAAVMGGAAAAGLGIIRG